MINDNMTNDKMLMLIRAERPTQVIHEVFSFKKNKFNFYSVTVDMESYFPNFFENTPPTKILHGRFIIPYPVAEYLKLSKAQQFSFRWEK